MTRFTTGNDISSRDNTESRLKRVEEKIAFYESSLFNTFLKGRLRTDITTAPTSSADINSTTRLYDVVILTDSQYIVINDSGTLAWRKITLDTF